MPRIVVLGCGLIGRAIVVDLAAEPGFEVVALDKSPKNLERVQGIARVRAAEADLQDPRELARWLAECDLVVGAMPSFLAFDTLAKVLEAKRPVVDISFMKEDARELDPVARQAGVVAVVDAGLAPGLSNLLVARAAREIERPRAARIYVGGLPRERTWPYQYKAPFAPGDVIEEYTRPARFRVGGALVVKDPLTDPELMEFPGIGTLEAFNTDGLRSLLDTVDIPDLSEKTLRYPGHRELMEVFRRTGFFSTEEIDVGNVRVRPRDLVSRLLFPHWSFGPGERDFAVLRVEVEGTDGGKSVRIVHDLVDEYDARTGLSAMARTTGFTATGVARLVLGGAFTRAGVHPPEALAEDPGALQELLRFLETRGIRIDSARHGP